MNHIDASRIADDERARLFDISLNAHEALLAGTDAEREASLELAELAAQWRARAWADRAPPSGHGGGGRIRLRAVPLPERRVDWSRTIPGMPIPVQSTQTDEQPFPLVKVVRLPGIPRNPTPARGMPRFDIVGPNGPQHEPASLFVRALAWTLKSGSR